jgi:hypothetical protein
MGLALINSSLQPERQHLKIAFQFPHVTSPIQQRPLHCKIRSFQCVFLSWRVIRSSQADSQCQSWHWAGLRSHHSLTHHLRAWDDSHKSLQGHLWLSWLRLCWFLVWALAGQQKGRGRLVLCSWNRKTPGLICSLYFLCLCVICKWNSYHLSLSPFRWCWKRCFILSFQILNVSNEIELYFYNSILMLLHFIIHQELLKKNVWDFSWWKVWLGISWVTIDRTGNCQNTNGLNFSIVLGHKINKYKAQNKWAGNSHHIYCPFSLMSLLFL